MNLCQSEIFNLQDCLEQLRERAADQIEASEKNEKQAIFRIPKLFLIRHIFIFLEENEIIRLTGVCKAFQAVIYSPISFKVLMSYRQ